MSTSTVVEDDATPISAPLPPPPAATGTQPTAATGTQPTAPVDKVPEPPPVVRTSVSRRRRDHRATAGLVLGVTALVLLELGLLLRLGAAHAFWTTLPLWSGFATLAALLGVLACTARGARPGADRAWRVSAAALTGLAVFWLLVVLPVANTDRGFVLTAALGCLGVSLWLAPGRTA